MKKFVCKRCGKEFIDKDQEILSKIIEGGSIYCKKCKKLTEELRLKENELTKKKLDKEKLKRAI